MSQIIGQLPDSDDLEHPIRLAGAAQVGEDHLLEADLADLDARVRRGAVATYESDQLTLGRSLLDHVLTPQQDVDPLTRTADEVVLCQQRLGRPGDHDVPMRQHDEVVTDPLEVGDEVRGQDDGDAALGDRLHQHFKELAPGERIESRNGFVEEQDLGTLRHRDGKRNLCLLPARKPPARTVERNVEPLQPAPG